MNRLASLLLTAVFLLGSSSSVPAFAQSSTHIVLVHTNDLHGQVLPRNEVGGIAEISAIIKKAKPDLILDAGDMFTGGVIVDEFQGVPIVEAMNKIGYHAAALGNHEFDYGIPALQARVKEARFPILSANVNSGVPGIRKYIVVTAKGIRFGIIGLTTEFLMTTTHPKNLGNVSVQGAVKAVSEILPEVRAKSDVIILLCHVDGIEEKRLAAAFPEIRVIIGGHNHQVLGPFWIGETLVSKTGSAGRYVGRVDLEIVNNRVMTMKGRLIPVRGVPPDPEIALSLKAFEDKVSDKMKLVVGEAAGDLQRKNDGESPLSNLIADAVRERTKTDVVLHNLGGIRKDIRKGVITWGEVFEVLPFQNTLVTLSLTGAQLRQVLERNVMAVSGIRVRWDRSRPSGQQIEHIALANGRPLEDHQSYSITTNDFLAAGGDGITEFVEGKNVRDTTMFLRNVVVDYIKARHVVAPTLDGRITLKNAR